MTRVMSSPYMEWAKLHSGSRYNLASSGLVNYPLAELQVTLADLELSGPAGYGYAPLQQAIARHCGVDPACVVAANGTSMANHLAMAAVFAPGDEVLIEHPTYELLTATAQFLGARVRHFNRKWADGFRIDPAEIERVLTPRTRLIVISNLHNPSGVFTDNDTLRQIGGLARRVGSRVLVDEVYREALFEARPPSAIQLGEEFIVTGSLTKAYGLSGLRCGWILAEPELAKRIWRLNDLFGVNAPHVAERLSVLALAQIERLARRAREILQANRHAWHTFLDSRPDLQAVRTEFGMISFPRLLHGSVEDLCTRLREQHDTTVVPGHFFGMSPHFRVALGGPVDMVAAGLQRLARALDDLHA
ncbi:MAG: pyridoxal phosphate-dependent aminotransferase [candidate division KSB1 bacterium]|nr:pyridoxal phosphate-dependent aminotransferase [candidate division KSB1 bacterium]MDZ7274585.1 pyridoxal phosphate-dependent aminotransferase [candidate division KSB1 bacterium]MDZ7284754.1 pyridoxal phosphate-dependent aminotransferase [candidate division KSB1 bacterium]MDZ7297826.1 pyridoxal phosphate-dependent aminotransferase [candidate division KSB1 bacterium]MDZ7307790.1 pyridoxal phosphate-dependent aminotransferase [candidate division KSB1 bacterium]